MSGDWPRLDREHVWHPYTHLQSAPPPLPVERAEGVWLYTPGGRRILDGISSWWVNIHGHGHPRLNRALEAQARRLEQVIFAGFTHEPAARLAARLVDLAPPGLTRVFYSDDGSTAVEVALKVAAQYWRHRGEPQRTLFVAFEHAYHGDTFGAMAAGGIPLFREPFEPFLFAVRRAPVPYRPVTSPPADPEALRLDCRRRLDEILEAAGGRAAAVIMEPLLQGAGGMILWPVSFLRDVEELCRHHGVLLIADEVFTGFGRTGRLFACEHGPVRPDILCLSKALTGGYLPLGATLVTERVYEAFLGADPRRTLFHGHSYTANALACAVAIESLAILEEERTLARVQELEKLFAARLEALRGQPAVGDARGIGGLAVLELHPGGRPGSDPAAGGGYLAALGRRLAAELLERGILLRPLGNVLYFLPPYAITDAEAHWVFDQIEEVLAGL